MIKMSNHRLNRLKEQREKINARIQVTEARLKNSERKKNVRKKILIGAYYFDMAVKESKMDSINIIMDRYLTRNSDRILFELNPLIESKESENKA